MGWIIYNSRGEPLVTQEQHNHTSTEVSGPLTDDEHDGFSEYDVIPAPGAPAASKARLYAKDLGATSSAFYVDEAGNEFWLADSIFKNLPITTDTADWSSRTSGGSVIGLTINRLDIRPSAGSAHVYLNNNNWGVTRGSASAVVNWARTVLVKIRFTLFTASASSTDWMSLGKAITDSATGGISRKGIGIAILNNALQGELHDGSSKTITAPLATLTTNQVYDLLMVSNGDGTGEWYLDGVSIGTGSGGPTGLGLTNACAIRFEATNASGADGRMFIHQIDVADLA